MFSFTLDHAPLLTTVSLSFKILEDLTFLPCFLVKSTDGQAILEAAWLFDHQCL